MNFVITIKKSLNQLFRLSVVAVLIALTGCNNQTSNKISLKLSAQPSYQANGKVVLDFSVSNHTSHALKFLKWGTPFENLLTRDMFDLTKNGQSIPYHGIMIKRGKPQERDYITLNAKQTLHASIDITKAYSLNAPGVYQVRYKQSFPDIMGAGILKVPATNSVSFQIK